MNKRKVASLLTAVLAVGSIFGITTPSTIVAEGEIKYTVETKEVYAVHTEGNRVVDTIKVDYITNPNGGPTLGLLHVDEDNDNKNDYLLEVVDGQYTYAFKDMNKNGVLDPYEDWRLSVDERAQSLADELSATDEGIAQIAGLMLFSAHEGDSYAGLTDAQKTYLTDSNVRNITDSAGNNVTDAVGWSNAMQAFVEESEFNVPVNFSSDPRSTAGSGDLYSSSETGTNISGWPSNIGMAATFDENHMYNFARATSAEYRAMGIITALGPQIDLASDPRWLRVGGTFGENTKLATMMAQAYVDGSQSSYASNGNDLGWGTTSINAMIKHFPGDGAGEGGRESHMKSGKYAVYPGNNFAEHLIPFSQGGLKLKGKTGSATSVMTSYSIGINADGSAVGGERVGSAYSKHKLNLLRNDLNYDGVVCTDWGVTSTPPPASFFGMAWGMEDKTVAERHYAILEAGSDMFGGNNDAAPIVEAYGMMVNEHGEAYAKERFATSARRLLKLTMQVGMFENPYLNLDESLATAGSDDKMSAGYAAQLDSVVMLKNKNNTIQTATASEKAPSEMTVYIPMTFTDELPSLFGTSPATWSESMNLDVARSIYGTVITDIQQPDGSYVAPDLSNVDKVIVGMRSVNNGTQFSNAGLDTSTNTFYPLSLQYKPYVADGDNVRRTSIAGDLNGGTQENRSYYGQTSKIYNSYDLTSCLNAVDAVKATGKNIPIVVSLNASNPVIVSEFENKVDAIVVGFSVSDKAIFDIVEGNHEPNGLLPVQFPANMDTVEASLEDVPEDVDCYKDSQGNTYDVAYGLNWSGLIDDERVSTYNPDRPVTEIEKVAITFTGIPDGSKIKVGDKFTLVPSEDGLTNGDGWEYDTNIFSATFNSPATFTALKEGKSTITFTSASGNVGSVTINVVGATAPSTEASKISSPSTGDKTNTYMLYVLGFASLAVLSGYAIYKKRIFNK